MFTCLKLSLLFFASLVGLVKGRCGSLSAVGGRGMGSESRASSSTNCASPSNVSSFSATRSRMSSSVVKRIVSPNASVPPDQVDRMAREALSLESIWTRLAGKARDAFRVFSFRAISPESRLFCPIPVPPHSKAEKTRYK